MIAIVYMDKSILKNYILNKKIIIAANADLEKINDLTIYSFYQIDGMKTIIIDFDFKCIFESNIENFYKKFINLNLDKIGDL